MVLKFENSTLQSLFDKKEFDTFTGIVQETSKEFKEIQGVLVTGSLVQYVRLPDFVNGRELNAKQKAYDEVVCRSHRKFFPHLESDLDIWLLVDDASKTEYIPSLLDERSLDLLDWYSKQRKVDMVKWVKKKNLAFGDFYKVNGLFPKSWNRSNELPYFGWGFKETLVDNIGSDLKPVRDRIKGFFLKRYPTDFLEVRAFPSVVFNLRPEKVSLDGVVDRSPFAYFMKDWLDLEQNCVVLYKRDNKEDYIYPFNKNGVVRGQRIADELDWNYKHMQSCVSKRTARGD